MSLFRAQRALFGISNAANLIPARPLNRSGTFTVSNDSAMRHSAVWACLRLRANMMSTFPVDVYRKVNGMQVEMPKPPILSNPGGERVDLIEWLYSSQVDLDRAGNAIGLITEVNSLGLPARIELQPISDCTVIMRKGQLVYRIAGTEYQPEKVWHEKQYTVSGLPMGLSPVAYAAMTIGEFMSIQEFVLAWFGGAAVPKARLRNVNKTVTKEQGEELKNRWRYDMANGDLFVTGSDWEYDPIQGQTQDMAWLEGRRFGITEISRFFDCPADLVDGMVAGQAVTYANMTQRNLQFLIMHMAPAIIRRENALSRLLPAPRFLKFNTDALLRMDAHTRAGMFEIQIRSRQRAPSEVRALDNLPPFTPEQLAEIAALAPPVSSLDSSRH